MRLILVFGSLLWNPHSQHEIDMIERIQSHFLKYASTNLSVSGLSTLEFRRLCQVLQLYYSILNNLCCLKPDKFFVINNRQNLRGSSPNIKNTYNPHIRISKFVQHQIYLNLWNSLSHEAVFSQSFSLFSSRLYNELLLLFLYVI